VWQRSNQVQKLQRIRKYIVLTDLNKGEEEFNCICSKFNKDIILCSHILKVMIEKEVSMIPDKYILDRWRKRDVRLVKQKTEENTVATSSLLKFNVLTRKSTIMNSKASKKEEAIEYLMAEMDRIDLHLDKLLAPQRTDEAQNELNSHE